MKSLTSRILVVVAVLIGTLFVAEAVAKEPKTIGPVCEYEIVRTVENGEVVSEVRTEVCHEKTIEGDQEILDPETKKELVTVLMYVAIGAIFSG